MNNHQHINQTSKKTEWYTDPEILAAARKLMGGIDLDPSSSAAANKHVQATRFFSAPDYVIDGIIVTVIEGEPVALPVRRYHDWGGLDQWWDGRIFLNHPFGQPEKACKPGCLKKGCQDRGWHTATDLPGSEDWIHRLVDAHKNGAVAINLCFSATSEAWFQPLKEFPQIHISPRLNYFDPDGKKVKGVTKGSCLTYLGGDVKGFAKYFIQWGRVQVPYYGQLPG